MNKKIKKILKITGISLLLLVLILSVTVAMLCNNEISSVLSIKMLADKNEANKSAPVYIMDVKGDYYFDEF